MTITLQEPYVYLVVTLVLMLIQVIQISSIRKLKREIEDLWQQISILAITATNAVQNLEKKIDEKQDKKI